jgi:RNA polymerase sigma-70 factor, ECF subfamily
VKTAELLDERLLVEAAQGDPGRFGDLYESHFEAVYAFVSRRVGSRDLAEDLTSDVFRRALEFLPRFEWRGIPFRAWLFRIAANVIADRSKQARRESALSDPEDLASPDEHQVEDSENRARLFQLVSTLPDDQQHVIRMRFSEDRSIREIAAALGRTDGAVKQLQFRALKNLRARWGESHG